MGVENSNNGRLPTCATCRHWRPFAADDATPDEKKDYFFDPEFHEESPSRPAHLQLPSCLKRDETLDVGQCRRYPPVFLPLKPVDDITQAVNATVGWPTTWCFDGCGEWSAHRDARLADYAV